MLWAVALLFLPLTTQQDLPELHSITTLHDSQQDANLKFNSAYENKKVLCDSSDTNLCNLKDFSKPKGNTLVENISKPSRDLVPPINDLGEDTEVRAKSKISDSDAFSPIRLPSQKAFFGANEKPKKLLNVLKRKKEITNPAFSESSVSKNAEATNELRSYLPPQPEIFGAAQTSVSVVQKPDQNNNDDHHHHHHHHGHNHENFDICADAFHSFLCSPLKARKRITGALPNQFSGQSSFIQSQKVLPNPEKVPAPSNVLPNEYLPAVSDSRISSTIRTTSRPKTTSFRPYSEEIPSSSDKFYLPPVSSNENSFLQPFNKKEITVIQTTTTQSPKAFPSSIVPSIVPKIHNEPSPTFISVPITPKPIITSTATPLFPVIPQSSNQDRFYLPPQPNVLPAASFNFVSQQSSSVAPQTVKPVFTTGIRVLPTVSTILPISQNTIHIPQQTKLEFISTTFKPTIYTTTAKFPSSPLPVLQFGSSFQPKPAKVSLPQPKYQTASNFIVTTTIKPYQSSPKNIPQPANSVNAYLPPNPNIQPEAAQISPAIAVPNTKNPVHHGRDLCTDPFHSFLCVGPKPRKRITGALPSGFRPDSSNSDEVVVKPSPSFQSEKKVIPEKPLVPAAAQSVGYQYPKPSNPLPISTKAPSTGYSYPKPEKIFPLPSQQEVIKYTTPEITTTAKPDLPLKTSEAKVVSGYQYPKPEVSFPLPSEQQNNLETTSSPEGYSYPKPDKPFSLPTKLSPSSSSESVVSLPTNQLKGYQYPKPQQSLNLPEKKGYSYPKPEKRLELPTETQSRSTLSPANSDIFSDAGSAEFIPVNKLNVRRDGSRSSLSGYPKFGEKVKKREKKLSD